MDTRYPQDSQLYGKFGPGLLQKQSIFETVAAYGLRIGLGKITPHYLHYLRRTFAKFAHQGRAPLEQV